MASGGRKEKRAAKDSRKPKERRIIIDSGENGGALVSGEDRRLSRGKEGTPRRDRSKAHA